MTRLIEENKGRNHSVHGTYSKLDINDTLFYCLIFQGLLFLLFLLLYIDTFHKMRMDLTSSQLLIVDNSWTRVKEDDDDGMASDPEAKLCHYVKASIQPPLSPALYPVSWYLRSKHGDLSSSRPRPGSARRGSLSAAAAGRRWKRRKAGEGNFVT